VTYPLVVLSTRLQVQIRDAASSDRLYSGSIDALLKILKKEGWKGLYGGLSSALVGVATSQGVYYYWYSLIRSIFEGIGSQKKELGDTLNSISASLAGCATVLVTNPIWVINIRMQLQGKESRGIWNTFLKVINEEGVLGLWKGVIPALILVANPTIQYTAAEKLKIILLKRRSNNKLTRVDIFFIGAMSKLVATLITYPYITVKTRLQMKQNDQNYNGTLDVMLKIIRNEGFAGFFKGIRTKLLQSVLNSAFLFLSQEELSALITKILTFLVIALSRFRLLKS